MHFAIQQFIYSKLQPGAFNQPIDSPPTCTLFLLYTANVGLWGPSVRGCVPEQSPQIFHFAFYLQSISITHPLVGTTRSLILIGSTLIGAPYVKLRIFHIYLHICLFEIDIIGECTPRRGFQLESLTANRRLNSPIDTEKHSSTTAA